MEKESIIDFITREIKGIQGEVLLQGALISEHDENIKSVIDADKYDPIQHFIYLKKANDAKIEHGAHLKYLEGKFDAYFLIIKELELCD